MRTSLVRSFDVSDSYRETEVTVQRIKLTLTDVYAYYLSPIYRLQTGMKCPLHRGPIVCQIQCTSRKLNTIQTKMVTFILFKCHTIVSHQLHIVKNNVRLYGVWFCSESNLMEKSVSSIRTPFSRVLSAVGRTTASTTTTSMAVQEGGGGRDTEELRSGCTSNRCYWCIIETNPIH